MSTVEVARILGISRQRVHRLDPRLRPARNPAGHRIYDVAAVEQLLRERAAAAEGGR